MIDIFYKKGNGYDNIRSNIMDFIKLDENGNFNCCNCYNCYNCICTLPLLVTNCVSCGVVAVFVTVVIVRNVLVLLLHCWTCYVWL